MKYVSLRFCLLLSCLCSAAGLFGQLSLSKTDASGCGKQDGSITASMPVSGVEYALNGGGYQSSGQFDNLGAGTYTVSARKQGGNGSCMATEQIEIEDGSNINASVSGGGSFQFCDRGNPPEISLFCSATGGVAPLTYSWPNGRLDNAGPGTHTCTVTDKNGCRDDASATVVVIPIRCSQDPNDITGPAGYGLPRWVSINDRLPYLIRFENDPDFATAPAVKVVIEYVLDEDLNLFSVRLGDFGFANMLFSVPANTTFYSNRLDVRDSLDVFVDVTAGIDVTANKVFWIFEAIDPLTGITVTDPDLGVLPVNDTLTRRGEGFVNFSVKPKSTAITGDTILAQAAIIFDSNETINTNEYMNTVDAVAPTSQMINNLPAQVDTTAFTLSWTATDDPGGCGIRDYTLFYSVNGGPFQVFQSNIPDTFVVFQGVPGASYSFFTVAVDNVGNTEASKPAGEITVSIIGTPEITITGFSKAAYCASDSVRVNWTSKQVSGLDILLSANGLAGPFQPAGQNLDSAATYFQWLIEPGFAGCNPCAVIVRDTGATQLPADTALIVIYALPQVQAGSDTALCAGGFIRLQGSGAATYQWFPAAFLSSSTVSDPFLYPDAPGTLQYALVGTDANGCQNTDSLTVEVRAIPVVTLTGNPEICPGDTTVITASGGNAYSWNTGANTASVELTEAGIYTVTVTGGNTCTNTGSIVVGPGVINGLLVEAKIKIVLQGPYVSAVQLMHDSLRVKGLIPLSEPYTGLMNFTHAGGGGGEQTTAAVLATTGPNAIVDWVFLELRNPTDPTQVVATRAALLQRDGDVVDVDGLSPVQFGAAANQWYYLAARHRNHLGVQTAETIFYPDCEPVESDFRTMAPGDFYAFNGLNPAQRLIGDKYALWAGNGRIDYQLKYNGSNNDRTAVLAIVGLATPNAIVPGYLDADYNLDGAVKYNGSANDRNVVLGNVGITTPLAIIHDQVAR